ncbi:hypothetical protein ACWGS9_02350 [Bradyrhizobium sp. Arg314]
MAAGMHHAGVFRRIIDTGFLFDRQGIYIGANGELAVRLPAGTDNIDGKPVAGDITNIGEPSLTSISRK